jgi:hypothetical protein
MQSALTADTSTSGWDRSLYAFLAEKQQRSGSMRTVNAYANMLRDFFGRAGKTPDTVGPQMHPPGHMASAYRASSRALPRSAPALPA